MKVNKINNIIKRFLSQVQAATESQKAIKKLKNRSLLS